VQIVPNKEGGRTTPSVVVSLTRAASPFGESTISKRGVSRIRCASRRVVFATDKTLDGVNRMRVHVLTFCYLSYQTLRPPLSVNQPTLV